MTSEERLAKIYLFNLQKRRLTVFEYMKTNSKEAALCVPSSRGKKKKKEISLAYKMEDLIWKLGEKKKQF